MGKLKLNIKKKKKKKHERPIELKTAVFFPPIFVLDF